MVQYLGRDKVLVSDFGKYAKFETEGDTSEGDLKTIRVAGYDFPVLSTLEKPEPDEFIFSVEGYFIPPR